MELSKQEIFSLSHYTNVYRDDCERKIRRIRRNKAMLNARFESLPDVVIHNDGIESPDQEIAYLKECKAKAVIIKKKLELLKK